MARMWMNYLKSSPAEACATLAPLVGGSLGALVAGRCNRLKGAAIGSAGAFVA